MTPTSLTAHYDDHATDLWLRPVAIVTLSGVTYHLTIDEAFALRADLERACRAAIKANHAEAMRSVTPAVYGD